MTAPTPPTELPAAGAEPDPNDQTTFDARMFAFISWVSALIPSLGAALANVYDNALSAWHSAAAASSSADLSRQSATAAANSAASALSAPGTSATSATNLTIGKGYKTLQITAGKIFSVGQFVMIASASNPLKSMSGQIVFHNSVIGELSVSIVATGDIEGSAGDWVVSLTGQPRPAATQEEMQMGEESGIREMSPLRVMQAIDSRFASDSQAESGIAVDVIMSPANVKTAINLLAGSIGDIRLSRADLSAHWARCDGSTVLQSDFPVLFSKIGIVGKIRPEKYTAADSNSVACGGSSIRIGSTYGIPSKYGLFRSSNNGESFSVINAGSDFYFQSATNGINALVLSSSSPYRNLLSTTDFATLQNQLSQYAIGVCWTGSKYLVSAYNDSSNTAYLYASDTGVSGWSILTLPSGGLPAGKYGELASDGFGTVLLLSGSILYRSTDHGLSWSAVLTAIDAMNLPSIKFIGDKFVIFSRRHLLFSNDKGLTFSSAGFLPISSIRAVDYLNGLFVVLSVEPSAGSAQKNSLRLHWSVDLVVWRSEFIEEQSMYDIDAIGMFSIGDALSVGYRYYASSQYYFRRRQINTVEYSKTSEFALPDIPGAYIKCM